MARTLRSGFRRMALPALVLFLSSTIPVAAAQPRVIVMTDISPAAQEPDDMESMVRLLLYSNELAIEGLVATSSCWRANDSLRPDIITDIVKAYGRVRSNLLIHAQGFPAEADLLEVIKRGNRNGMAAVGKGKTSAGSDLIVKAVDKSDERPLWICMWGGAATLAQALYDIQESGSSAHIADVVAKLRVYDLSGQDDAGAWICKTFPGIFYIRSRLQWRGFSYRVDGLWPDSRGGDESLAAPGWFLKNIIQDHGPLGALYPQAKYLYEGDSPTFLNLPDRGLTAEPDNIDFGGWGGRFGSEKKKGVRTGSENASVIETPYDDYWMFTDATDTWRDNKAEYNNSYCAIFRWRTACQNDFAARMDWCVGEYGATNHNPKAVVNGDQTSGFIRITAEPDSRVLLDATGTQDSDKNTLSYDWRVYKEPGTYNGAIALSDTASITSTVTMPHDCAGKSFHVILTVKDDGAPNLYSYRRIILTGKTVTAVPDPVADHSGRKAFLRQSGEKDLNARVDIYSLDGKRMATVQRPAKYGVLKRSLQLKGISPGVYFAVSEIPGKRVKMCAE